MNPNYPKRVKIGPGVREEGVAFSLSPLSITGDTNQSRVSVSSGIRKWTDSILLQMCYATTGRKVVIGCHRVPWRKWPCDGVSDEWELAMTPLIPQPTDCQQILTFYAPYRFIHIKKLTFLPEQHIPLCSSSPFMSAHLEETISILFILDIHAILFSASDSGDGFSLNPLYSR